MSLSNPSYVPPNPQPVTQPPPYTSSGSNFITRLSQLPLAQVPSGPPLSDDSYRTQFYHPTTRYQPLQPALHPLTQASPANLPQASHHYNMQPQPQPQVQLPFPSQMYAPAPQLPGVPNPNINMRFGAQPSFPYPALGPVVYIPGMHSQLPTLLPGQQLVYCTNPGCLHP